MAWLRIDDEAPTHPGVLACGRGGDDRSRLEVWGFIVTLAAWSASHLTDGWVPAEVADLVAGPHAPRLLAQAARARRLSRRRRGPDGAPSYRLTLDDDLLHMRSREEVLTDRQHRNDTRDALTTLSVRLRDGDQCRYCGLTVAWADRKGARGGTYDHVDPTCAGTEDNLVVCCRRCNSAKRDRPLDDTDLTLLPAPRTRGEQPYYSPQTQTRLHEAGLLERPGTQPDTAHRSDPAASGTPLARTARATPPPAGHRASTAHPTARQPAGERLDAPPAAARPPPDLDLGDRPGSAGSGRDGSGQAGRQARRGRARRGQSGVS